MKVREDHVGQRPKFTAKQQDVFNNCAVRAPTSNCGRKKKVRKPVGFDEPPFGFVLRFAVITKPRATKAIHVCPQP